MSTPRDPPEVRVMSMEAAFLQTGYQDSCKLTMSERITRYGLFLRHCHISGAGLSMSFINC
jgi:hypothetical protein